MKLQFFNLLFFFFSNRVISGERQNRLLPAFFSSPKEESSHGVNSGLLKNHIMTNTLVQKTNFHFYFFHRSTLPEIYYFGF